MEKNETQVEQSNSINQVSVPKSSFFKFREKRNVCINDENLRKEIQKSMSIVFVFNILLVSGFFKFLEFYYFEKLPSYLFSAVPNKAKEAHERLRLDEIKNKTYKGLFHSLVHKIYFSKFALSLFFMINLYLSVKTFLYFEKMLNSKKLDFKYTFYSLILSCDDK